MTKQQLEKIKEEEKNQFNNFEQLENFINSYVSGDDDIDPSDLYDLDDNIHEYADGLVPIYNHDIAKEWQENTEAHELTLEHAGEYNEKSTIYEMMSSDLYYYYYQKLSEDFDRLKDLLDA